MIWTTTLCIVSELFSLHSVCVISVRSVSSPAIYIAFVAFSSGWEEIVTGMGISFHRHVGFVGYIFGPPTCTHAHTNTHTHRHFAIINISGMDKATDFKFCTLIDLVSYYNSLGTAMYPRWAWSQ